MKKLASIIVCLFLLISCVLPAAAAGGVPKAVMAGTKSVVRITSQYRNHSTTGSGFVIQNVPGDVLIVISASGNSPSVVEAAKLAREKGGRVIAMTGFTGGKLMEISDICLHADDTRYETVEDAHSTFCHLIVSCVKSRLKKGA